MKRPTLILTLTLGALLSVAALGISAAVDSPRTLMSRGDYRDGTRAIEAATRQAIAKCRDATGVDKDICKARARGEERVKKAELQARYYGTVAAANDVQVAKAKAHYEVERARCGARAGDDRSQCLRTAREGMMREASERKVAAST